MLLYKNIALDEVVDATVFQFCEDLKWLAFRALRRNIFDNVRLALSALVNPGQQRVIESDLRERCVQESLLRALTSDFPILEQCLLSV